MAQETIISVEQLAKRYRLGQIGATTLRESAERAWHRLRGRDPAAEMGEVGRQSYHGEHGGTLLRSSSFAGHAEKSASRRGAEVAAAFANCSPRRAREEGDPTTEVMEARRPEREGTRACPSGRRESDADAGNREPAPGATRERACDSDVASDSPPASRAIVPPLAHCSAISASLRETAPSASSASGFKFHPSSLDSDLWALRDISFEVARGEVMGIIGRNGAGKSTLLKILSRITEPTSGRAILRGRVNSLLEVGTGFHPELTGRENIYLNGAIHGMKRAEIARKFDEIVAFSEVEKFIDTPVKRYSSGMYVRLAFAVAAHLEPEILLVDEVLAVGDLAFQKKCLGKMQSVAGQGRTVLFVSHNMAAMQALCRRAILLSEGRIVFDGPALDTVASYVASVQEMVTEGSLGERTDRSGGSQFRFVGLDVLDGRNMVPVNTVMSGQDVIIRLDYDANVPMGGLATSIGVNSSSGSFLFACRSDSIGREFSIPAGRGSLFCRFPHLPLNAGRYSLTLMAYAGGLGVDGISDAGWLHVVAGDYYGTGRLPASANPGVFVDYDWVRR